MRPGRQKLLGTVEVDETYIGGERPGKRGRGAANKALVTIAIEDKGGAEKRGIGRIRLGRVPHVSAESLIGFVKENVEAGSVVRTDGWKGYDGLPTQGYSHIVVGSKELTIAHLVASLLKRWLLGTYQGAVQTEHFDYYLDEFTFRFNIRKSGSRGKLFYRLIQQCAQSEPFAGSKIVGGKQIRSIPKE